MRNIAKPLIILVTTIACLQSTTALAVSDKEIETLKAEVEKMRSSYERQIGELNDRIKQLEASKTAETKTADAAAAPKANNKRNLVTGNEFNPAIGVILNGKYQQFSEGTNEVAGFGVGEEGERGNEGLAIDESELNFSANVDDKFAGSVTTAIVREDGEDKVGLEEAYIQTLSLPYGLSAKAGRALATLGYLNEHHTHADDFADRPLPYRAFLNNAFNDDGVEVSAVLPTDFYSEVGGGVWRGDDFPSGDANAEGLGTYSAYARVGGDIGDNQTWRLGGSYLTTKTGDAGRVIGDTGSEVTFVGDSNLYIVDAKYTIAPTGNARNSEIILQGEYFLRNEDGTYEDAAAATGTVDYDDSQTGWYGQVVYKFLPQWRAGYRYTQLNASDVPAGLTGSALDSSGHSPEIHSLMADWTNSEFSRVRLQYNLDEASTETDNQFIMQYIMSLGAHPAHKY